MLPLMAILLGFAPFFPEPHLFGKVKWLLGGGAITGEQSMTGMDWFDLFFHGLPLVFGVSYLVYLLVKK